MDFDGNKMEKAFLVNLKKTKTKKTHFGLYESDHLTASLAGFWTLRRDEMLREYIESSN